MNSEGGKRVARVSPFLSQVGFLRFFSKDVTCEVIKSLYGLESTHTIGQVVIEMTPGLEIDSDGYWQTITDKNGRRLISCLWIDGNPLQTRIPHPTASELKMARQIKEGLYNAGDRSSGNSDRIRLQAD